MQKEDNTATELHYIVQNQALRTENKLLKKQVKELKEIINDLIDQIELPL